MSKRPVEVVVFDDPTTRKRQKKDTSVSTSDTNLKNEFSIKDASREVSKLGQQALDKKSKKAINDAFIEALNGKVMSPVILSCFISSVSVIYPS